MTTRIAPTLWIFHFLAVAAATGLAFTGHKYDCFNVGPCKGDLDLWIRLGDLALYSFLGAWFALLVVTFLVNRTAEGNRAKALAWSAAVLVPIGSVLAASYVFNFGIVAAQV